MSEPTPPDTRLAGNAPMPDRISGDAEERASRPASRVSVVTRGGRFMGAFWERHDAEAYGARLLAESQVSHYKRNNTEPWQPPEIRVLEVEVQ